MSMNILGKKKTGRLGHYYECLTGLQTPIEKKQKLIPQIHKI